MQNLIHIELLGNVSIYLGIGIKIISAIFLGGLIGLDREKKMKSAGIKTNILICLGATLYTSISLLNLAQFHTLNTNIDPNRVAAQIVSGIGFLGAGAILHSRGGMVLGLTTAATIWVVAAVGYTIGIGYPLIACLFTVTILIVLNLITPIYKYFEKEKDHKYYHLEILTRGPAKSSIKQVVLNEIKTIEEVYEEILNNELDERILNVKIKIHPHDIKRMIVTIKDILRVEKVNYRMIPNFVYSDDD